MDSLSLQLKPLTAFGSPLMGDTLFGQLCWAVHHRVGPHRLNALLDGYTAGHPFAVVGDALPAGWLPRPALPFSLYRAVADGERKAVKRRRWVAETAVEAPVPDWLALAGEDGTVVTAATGGKSADADLLHLHPQPHNSINRLTGTTGRGDFAPYTLMQRWHHPSVPLCCRVLHDPDRITAAELLELFADVGQGGYGRDASIGLGKFAVQPFEGAWPAHPDPNACLTLAPCAPQGQGWDPRRSFYEVFTRFGRHGDQAALSGRPFKTPVLLARGGALLTPAAMPDAPFVGQGLGGDGLISKGLPETVQQGYAPCVLVHLPAEITA